MPIIAECLAWGLKDEALLGEVGAGANMRIDPRSGVKYEPF